LGRSDPVMGVAALVEPTPSDDGRAGGSLDARSLAEVDRGISDPYRRFMEFGEFRDALVERLPDSPGLPDAWSDHRVH